tara:strand:- start:6210 stop:7064 length:855 start_codon:yes stop_codon:yes gene_type:complete
MLLANELNKINPFTPPCWRWDVAKEIIKQPEESYVPEDQVTKDAVSYLRTQDEAQFPEIHAASQIYQEDGLSRAELEARILVGQSDAEIAGYCDLTTEVVSVYAKLLYCVRERITGSDWLLKHAVGEPHFFGYKNHNLRQLWAWFALQGLPVILDEVIRTYHEELKPTDTPVLSVYLRPGSRVSQKLQVVIAECIFSNFLSLSEWDLEFVNYYQLTRLLPTPEEQQTALCQYKQDRIKFAYQVLTGKLEVNPPKRKRDQPAPRSPMKEIQKIRKSLNFLETACS